MSRRKHSIIDKLPPETKNTVEEMIKSDFTYAEIADYIKLETDTSISLTSVWRYASNLTESIQSLKMAQENFRCVMEEIEKYPQLDTTEGIIRLLSNYVFETINSAPEEYWKSIDPDVLIKQSMSLVKAAAYKKNMDIKNKDILEAGYEQVKVQMFEAMAKEDPGLYTKVVKFLNKREDVE